MHQIFICFASKDEAVARGIVRFLEAREFGCWLASRDVGPGQNFQEAIVEAIQAAKVLVFLFSESSAKSVEIAKELALAGSCGIAVIPVRLSAIIPTGALRYELATRQWIDTFPDLQDALERLTAAVAQVLRPGTAAGAKDAAGVSADRAAMPPADPRPAREPIMQPGSEEFEAIRALLARTVGPIARVFVEKASADARSLDDLCERLAAHVRAPADRVAFLKAARVRLASLKAQR